MKVSHVAAVVDVAFDDPNLIADAGLVPVLALAEQIGLPELVAERVAIRGAANGAGANPAAKVCSLLAGMVAGADSIEDMDRLRHAGNSVVFDQIRAPSTLACDVVQANAPSRGRTPRDHQMSTTCHSSSLRTNRPRRVNRGAHFPEH
jgi:hypothetical protein